MSDSHTVLPVAAAIIENGGLILACRRNADRAQGGKWEFPGGKLEPGESAADALVREIHEELGVRIEVIEPFSTDDTETGDQVIRLICLRARLLDGEPSESSDHDELRWCSRDQLMSLEWAPADLPAVRRLLMEGKAGGRLDQRGV